MARFRSINSNNILYSDGFLSPGFAVTAATELPDDRLEEWLVDFDEAMEFLAMSNPNDAHPYMPSLLIFTHVHMKRESRWRFRSARAKNMEYLEFYRIFLFMLKYLSVARKNNLPIFDEDLFDFKRYPIIKAKYHALFSAFEQGIETERTES